MWGVQRGKAPLLSPLGGIKGGGSTKFTRPKAIYKELKTTGVRTGQRGVVSIEFLSPQVRALFFRAACGFKKSIDPL